MYADIDNIYEMQRSFKVITTACREGRVITLLQLLKVSKWQHHLQKLIRAATRCTMLVCGKAEGGSIYQGGNKGSGWAPSLTWDRWRDRHVEKATPKTSGTSVLVHCSDGWDRTPQVVSLAMLFLDPYYRTMRGFCHLIESQWLGFGHQFATRMGVSGNTKKNAKKWSPVFIQWLSAIAAVMDQYPTCFEFTTEFLIAIIDAVYACRFGNFLFNSDVEREHLHKSTDSIWEHLLGDKQHDAESVSFRSPIYKFHERHEGVLNVILPVSDSSRLPFFREFFLRWNFVSRPLPFYTQAECYRNLVQNLHLRLHQLESLVKSQKKATALRILNHHSSSASFDGGQAKVAAGFLHSTINQQKGRSYSRHRAGSARVKNNASFDVPELAEGVVWVSDASASKCGDCSLPFTFLRRRHHCRACGGVFCAKCSGSRVVVPGHKSGRRERVCNECERSIECVNASTVA